MSTDDCTRCDFLKSVTAGTIATAASGRVAAGSARRRRPNLIFIPAGDIGCYGQKQVQTPRLDQMARKEDCP